MEDAGNRMSCKTVFIRLPTMVNQLQGHFFSSQSAHCHAQWTASQGWSNHDFDIFGPNLGIYAIVMSETVGIDIHEIESDFSHIHISLYNLSWMLAAATACYCSYSVCNSVKALCLLAFHITASIRGGGVEESPKFLPGMERD